MNSDLAPTPCPICFGPGLHTPGNCHFLVEQPRRGDRIDLSTRNCTLARVINGIRYDTRSAFLVTSASQFDGFLFFRLQQVYRGLDGNWFMVQVHWPAASQADNDHPITPIPDAQVLATLRNIVRDQDCLPLLRDWYNQGWIPRNDALAQQWAEVVLTAD
ncbi:MAG: hypothetical protein ACREPL_13610, partial [Rhodanobacteraceae bacterium]